MLFGWLDPQDLIYYSRSCKRAYQQVHSYWRRAFEIYRFLAPFFTRGEAEQFRVIQALTGTLISGSSALQFLNRTPYPGSDLDIYVEHRYCKPIALFLQSIGYEFQPLDHQPAELDGAIARGSANMNAEYIGEITPTIESKRGFAGVYNMVRGGQKIQVITAKNSPLDIILNFHTTVVMNVISYSRAYSLYPKATFQKSYALICDHCDGAQATLRAIQKYTQRGWKMVDAHGEEWGVTTKEAHPGQLELRTVGNYLGNLGRVFRTEQRRYLGDSHCWTYRLPKIPIHYPNIEVPPVWQESRGYKLSTPLTCMEVQFGSPQAFEANCWTLQTKSGYFGDMKYHIFRNTLKLRFAYCAPFEWVSSSSAGLSTAPCDLDRWPSDREVWYCPKTDENQAWGDTENCDFQADRHDLHYREFVNRRSQHLVAFHNPEWDE
ncbi:hypothetical protein V5O48_006389 [Marasmius crinis-equi]|uniref:Uncharacterized protein n=1 Tax=Marasmius crinis-equi TaxID=585013 RepID=A0ABR3FJL4_9AGAR